MRKTIFTALAVLCAAALTGCPPAPPPAPAAPVSGGR